MISSRDDEWVEIYNAGDAPVTLDGYRIADADTSWRMELSGTLAPHARRLVYGLESYNWEKATHHSAFGLSLNNTGDSVRLWRWSPTDSSQVDVYTYNALSAGADRSVGRFPDGAPTWKLFDELNAVPAGSDPPGTHCSPSPGTANGCVTAIDVKTWGSMRLRFGARGARK